MYEVTAAAVRVVVGGEAHHLKRGARTPDGMSAEDAKRLVRKGMIAKVAEPEPEQPEPQPEPEPEQPEPEQPGVQPTKPRTSRAK